MSMYLFLFQDNSGGSSLIWTLLPFVFIFGIFYFLVIMPQKKQKQQIQEMIEDELWSLTVALGTEQLDGLVVKYNLDYRDDDPSVLNVPFILAQDQRE